MVGSTMWGLGESIDVVRHFGLLAGRELRQYRLSADDSEYHETEAVVRGGRGRLHRASGASLR
jgi:hypothetical protein